MRVEERLETVERELGKARRPVRRLLIAGAFALACLLLVAAWARMPEAHAQAEAQVGAAVRREGGEMLKGKWPVLRDVAVAVWMLLVLWQLLAIGRAVDRVRRTCLGHQGEPREPRPPGGGRSRLAE
jgi:hypothetical protein